MRGGKNTLFSSKIRQYHSPDGADGCCITSNISLTCLPLVFTSNWSNFWHAFASCGFVSVSWAFLLPARRYASAGIYESNAYICPSVHLSRAGIVKKKQASIVISSPSNSPTILVFWCQISSRHSKGFPERASQTRVGGEIQPFSSFKHQYIENGSRYGQSYY